MNRRQFLERGGRLALVAGAASFATLEWLAADAPAAGPLRKCVSLGGPGSLRQEGHPDDYMLWGNREYIRDSSRTTWVKLWVSWDDLQRELGVAPASRQASWRQLNGAPGGQRWLQRLDRQLKAVNDDGLGAILALYQAFPAWSSGATGPDPADSNKAAIQKVPLDLSPDGPWGWFIAYLLARYRRGAAPNPVGPHDREPGESTPGYDPPFGNPAGAAIDALEICNEPNHLYWPQENIVDAVARMIRSAELLSRTWGPTPILAPATSDFPDATVRRSAGIAGTVWSEFTQSLLEALRDFHPVVPVRWSHHNYRDVRLGETPSRAERVLAMLRGAAWSNEPQPLWLTEGGLNLGSHVSDPAARQAQARSIERNFRRMMRLPDVFMWTQHTISDKQGNNFKSGLRDDFVWGQGLGEERPSWLTWRELPGSSAL
jgi:hypothetical protein